MRTRPWDHGSFGLPWFTLSMTAVLAGCYLVFGPLTEGLLWNRAEIENGALWRLATGHLVHTDAAHLGWNIGAYLVLGGILESVFGVDAGKQAQLIAVGALAVGMSLYWLRPDLAWYAGFSGILHAYLVVLLWHLWRTYRHPTTLIVAAGTVTKIMIESFAGSSLVGAGVFPVVPEAHGAGIAAGVALVVVMFARNVTRPAAA